MKLLWYYLAAVNLIALLAMALDKGFAKAGTRRIPEKVLFLFVILGGGVGGTLGMFAYRHKTKHWYFKVFFPTFAILQLAGVVYLLAQNL